MDTRFNNLSSIGRPLDPGYATNRAIVIVTLTAALAGLAVQLVGGNTFFPSLVWAVSAGLAVFLAWALGRELDPDHDLSAFVGAALTILGLVFLQPNLLALFWMLLVLRFLNRTVGPAPTSFDLVLLVVLAAWVSWIAGWAFGLFTAAALFLDSRLPPPHTRYGLYGAGVSVFVAVAVLLLRGGMEGPSLLATFADLFALVAGLLFLAVIVTSRSLSSLADRTGERLDLSRLQVARLVALVFAAILVALSGLQGLGTFMPLWAVIVGVSLFDIYILIRDSRRIKA